MALKEEIGIRMKDFYEGVPKMKLMRRTPVIIRIDGKAFHTFTRGFERPFDDVLIKTMQETTRYLCENIQGCVLGYCQSDEISLVLVDYQTFHTSAWFDYEIQKMCSIAASMTTMAFNKNFVKNVEEFIENQKNADYDNAAERKKTDKLIAVYKNAVEMGGMFDARCFNIPREEVTNCIYWRQLDATRNSISMVGHANFSCKELHNKSCNDVQDMLMTQKGINWNNFPVYKKRGTCVIKEEYFHEADSYNSVGTWRTHWIIDKNIPIFKGEGREYIEKLVMVGE
jgi:tRNA(His) 5'-end guanylyltransferase